MKTPYSLMIHGGAMDRIKDTATEKAFADSLRRILLKGEEALKRDCNALEAVELCASLLEDDPLFNAGRGSVLNRRGDIEMDAAIMDGRDLSAGAVAAIRYIQNPIRLARLLLDHGETVMLVADGALSFAKANGVALVDDRYLKTQERIDEWQSVQDGKNAGAEHGTIGAVARDSQGGLAAATSTGGMVNKPPGRIGDSPIIGAGVYADNDTCAVSATGYGEDFMRCVIGKSIADYIAFKDCDGKQAVTMAMDHLRRKVKGRGGIIVIDRHGNCVSGLTMNKLVHAWIEHGGAIEIRV